MKKSLVFLGVWALITATLVLLAAGCSSKAVRYNPFRVPREQFYSSLKTIVLAPISTPKELEVSETVKAKFESLLATELRRAGFTVVTSEEPRTLWQAMADSVGGIYDPKSGEVDTARSRMIWDKVYSRLRENYDVNAVMYPGIDVVLAEFNNGNAKWHGTSENVQKGKFWNFLSGTSHFGTTRALSLSVSLKDSNNVNLYVNAGGIQALDKVGPFGGFEPVPQEELFAKEERNVKAVRLALDPLLGRKKK